MRRTTRRKSTNRWWTRGLALACMLLVALSGIGAFVAVKRAMAVAGPFSCKPGFYQVLGGQLLVLDPTTGLYTKIGTWNSKYGSYNALGYNPKDGFLYALSSDNETKSNLMRIASDGSITDLGFPTGLIPVGTGESYFSGDFDGSGNLYVRANPQDGPNGPIHRVFRINVAARPVKATEIVLPARFGGSDMSWINGVMYSVQDNNLFRYNIGTNTVTSVTVSGLSATAGTFGASWTNRLGQFFVASNGSGQIYRISGKGTDTPSAVPVVKGEPMDSGGNDGAACSLASDPFGLPVVQPDAYSVAANSVLEVSAPGLLANDDVQLLDDGTVQALTVASAPSRGTLSVTRDGGFLYTPKPWTYGTDTFSYTVTDRWGRLSDRAAVQIDVLAPAAPAPQADSYAVSAGTTATRDATSGVLANDAGSALQASVRLAPSSGGSIVMQPSGAFTYTPLTGFSGTETVTYEVTDAFGRSASATVAFTVSAPAIDPVVLLPT